MISEALSGLLLDVIIRTTTRYKQLIKGATRFRLQGFASALRLLLISLRLPLVAEVFVDQVTRLLLSRLIIIPGRVIIVVPA